MTTRLVALVMLPVTAVCLLSGSVVLSRRAASTQALAVQQGINGLSELVALRNALHEQQTVETFDVHFDQLGVTGSTASTFLGFDVAAQFAPARGEAARAIASLGGSSPISSDMLISLFAAIDGGFISPTAAVESLGRYLEVIGEAVTSGLDRLELKANQGPLAAALESLREANGLLDAATPQGIDLSAVLVPSPGDTTEAKAAVLVRVGAESADYAAAVARIRELGVKSVVADLGRIEADPQVHAFDQAVAVILVGKTLTEPGAKLDTTKIVTPFRGYLVRDSLLNDLVSTATRAVRDEARHLAGAERTGFVIWALLAVALALASVAVALLLARTISRPLKDLAGYAAAVKEGQLDAEGSRGQSHGPRETRLAFSVFADLVTNLRLLDAKANALAHCDFDDPVLNQPLPGRLGRSLESSVEVLSGSIVERDELQTHLAHEATHDSLTGIGNRPAAITGIQAAMNRAARTGAVTALLYMDLNDFKAVNDSHGHEVGDEVLRQIANRISAHLRSADFVARLGGDEFVVVAEAIAGLAEATDLARRIIDAVSQPIKIGALRITVGAAVGIAMTVDGPEEPFRLLARADAAMNRAKHHERSAIEIFDADLQRQMVEREDVEAALTAALADPGGGGLRLVYQPVLEAMSGVMVGAEALIRWDRPGHGLLPPDSFIPIAEATALIIDLDCWVLNEAARQLVAWSSVPELGDVRVAVNISGRHLLSRRLPGHIRAVLDQTGIDPHRILIEITETVLLTDLTAAAAELDAVHALGVEVAIDDFGTGYTSLAHLQQLPIDIIKVDRSFVIQLGLGRGTSLVRMIVDLGHAIGISIIAEGVETGDQMSALQAMGTDQLQGFLLSRPLEANALPTWADGRVAAMCRASADSHLASLLS